jgi:prepilin-type N-terminal cleavage/methylation domain-containing protein
MCGSNGFSLIELLIVVAVISLLVSIALPNYMESLVRAKVARTQADLAHVNRLVIAYETDSGEYLEDSVQDPLAVLNVLTTPFPYTHNLPIDICRSEGDPDYGKSYFYATRSGHFEDLVTTAGWMHGRRDFEFALASYGPDGVFAHGAAVDVEPYDGTNGTISAGNLWRFGP